MCKTFGINKNRGISYYDYDKVWHRLINYVKQNDQSNVIQGSFVGYDDSPRRGTNGSKIIKGATHKNLLSILDNFLISSVVRISHIYLLQHGMNGVKVPS